jgi:hypothetical protein
MIMDNSKMDETMKNIEKKESKVGGAKVVMFGTVPGILLGAAGAGLLKGVGASSRAAEAEILAETFVAEDIDDEGLIEVVPVSAIEESEMVAEAEIPVMAEVAPVSDEADIEPAVVVADLPEDDAEEPEEVDEVVLVTDEDMSFSEAFTAAREEGGSDAIFEWRGNYYSAHTKDEWDSMDESERDAVMERVYGASESDEVLLADQRDPDEPVMDFGVDRVVRTTSEDGVNVVVGEAHINGRIAQFKDSDGDGLVDQFALDSDGDGEIQEIEINQAEAAGITVDMLYAHADQIPDSDLVTPDFEMAIEVKDIQLATMPDGTDVYLAEAKINETEVMLADTDADGNIDTLMVDENHDGVYDENSEIVDFRNAGITVDRLMADLDMPSEDDDMLEA